MVFGGHPLRDEGDVMNDVTMMSHEDLVEALIDRAFNDGVNDACEQDARTIEIKTEILRRMEK